MNEIVISVSENMKMNRAMACSKGEGNEPAGPSMLTLIS